MATDMTCVNHYIMHAWNAWMHGDHGSCEVDHCYT